MRKILIVFLALQLTACAANQTLQSAVDGFKSTVNTVVNPDNFDTISAAYGSALASAVTYRNLCERKVIDKSCWKTISLMQPYENKIYNAYKVLQKFVRNNPNADASQYISLTRDAINSFTSIQTQNGVK